MSPPLLLRPVQALPPCDMIDPSLSQPPPQGLIPDRDPVTLSQLLGCKRQSKIPILLRIEAEHRRLDLCQIFSIVWLITCTRELLHVHDDPILSAHPPCV